MDERLRQIYEQGRADGRRAAEARGDGEIPIEIARRLVAILDGVVLHPPVSTTVRTEEQGE